MERYEQIKMWGSTKLKSLQKSRCSVQNIKFYQHKPLLHYITLHCTQNPNKEKKNWVLNNFQNPGRKTLKTTNEGLDMNNKSEETCEGQQRKA